MKGYLVLENGRVFAGKLLNDCLMASGEVVFSTAMISYQDIITDPSYYGQIVVETMGTVPVVHLERMVSLFTTGPAEILGLDRGTLTPGKVADITLLDPNMIRTVVPANFYSKGKNTPFGGRELKGWPYMTIRAGKIVAREGKIMG